MEVWDIHLGQWIADAETGQWLTRWTIRVALLLYLATLVGELLLSRGSPLYSRLRWPWTLAYAAFLAHVVSAFHYYHGWSHQHAFHDTARQTEEVLGIAFGYGIYFSYLFTAVWAADVAWWWVAPRSYRQRPGSLHGGIHVFLFFIALNGAAVFESGVTRWLGIPASLALGLLLIYRLIRNNRT